MKNFTNIFNGKNFVITNFVRHLRYLRKEFLGEYLPKVDEKHLEAHRTNPFTKYSQIDKIEKHEKSDHIPDANVTKLYPECFPYLPLVHMRDSLRERLEIREMMKRRKHLEIPEFYVGSIMAVTIADPYTPTKSNRFVGICIYRNILGLMSTVRLRNVIDDMGIEIEYELYNPTVLKIEVLKLEKRLDENLMYLRDALPEYSTVPLDMVAGPKPVEVPLNTTKVRMKPPPWRVDWHHHNFRGIDDDSWKSIKAKKLGHIQDSRTQIERYDLMKIYRERGPLFDRHGAMRQVEILHHHIVDYHQQRYKELLAQLRIDREKQK